jgi:hypothetical protein
MTDKKYKPRKDRSDDNYGEQPDLLEGKERKVHEEIVSRIIEGGAAPTPGAYARALKQWQRLAGSIVRSPTDPSLKVDESSRRSAKQVSSQRKTDT